MSPSLAASGLAPLSKVAGPMLAGCAAAGVMYYVVNVKRVFGGARTKRATFQQHTPEGWKK